MLTSKLCSFYLKLCFSFEWPAWWNRNNWPHFRETGDTWHTIDTSLINGVVTSAFAYSSLCKKQNCIFMCLRSGESLIRQYVKKRLLASKIFANFVTLYLEKETLFRFKTFRRQTNPKTAKTQICSKLPIRHYEKNATNYVISCSRFAI